MIDYKNKKFQLQKELESVYYGLAERSLKQTKTSEEIFLQRQDELKNSVSTTLHFIIAIITTLLLLLLLRFNVHENANFLACFAKSCRRNKVAVVHVCSVV